MTRSAAGVDYNPFQLFQRLVLTRPREVYYIGGSDVLPAPLESEERGICDQQAGYRSAPGSQGNPD